MTPEIYDDRVCALGEGPLWHPQRRQLFWFDILGKRLLSRDGHQALSWQFEDHVSAAGWVERDTLMIASERALFTFNVKSEAQSSVIALESEKPETRSNDGRADPWGGFWIGTMGKAAEPGAGAIYRYYKGTLRKLFDQITVSNAICFAPSRAFALFTDTLTQRVMRVALHPDTGWPDAEPMLAVDLRPHDRYPDGAVIDAGDQLWLAEWGSGRVSVYDPAGNWLKSLTVPALHSTCPAFGGSDMFVTSAVQGQPGPDDGKTFVFRGVGRGQLEHRVEL